MINNPVAFSIDYLADASKDIPNMVVQLSFLVMSGIIVMVFAFANDLNQARKGVMTTVLIEYMFLILGSCVIGCQRVPEGQVSGISISLN